MQRAVAVSVLSLIVAYAQSQTAATVHRAHSAPSSSTPAKKTIAHARAPSANAKVSPSKTALQTGTHRGKHRKIRAKAGPSYQLHPDPERYKQIQQALADKGYFKGQVNGEWGADSVEALKKFQSDQKIDDDGKINALSLIGLGLGPKHDGTSGRTGPVPPPGPETPAAMPPAPVEPPASSPEPPPE